MRILLRALLLIFVLASACAKGSQSEEAYKKVTAGMSRAEVEAILGRPKDVLPQPMDPSLVSLIYDVQSDSHVGLESDKVIFVKYKGTVLVDKLGLPPHP